MHQPRFPPHPPARFRVPQAGDTITNQDRTYQIGDQIGAGAFGDVFECSDDWSNPLVAKVLLPKNQRFDHLHAMWSGEVGNLLALRHPNVTFLQDAFECEGGLYMIIERLSLIHI